MIIPAVEAKKIEENNNKIYNTGIYLYEHNRYNEAIEVFESLNGYKDSETYVKKCYIIKYGADFWERYSAINIGDEYAFFGEYEQDINIANGKEGISWFVLDKKNGSLLLISKYALDCKRYNNSNESVTWETCSLRTWLNNDFYNAAFSEQEKSKIKTTLVTADKNPKFSTNPGNDTNYKVFLLSITEVNKYFLSDNERRCAPTAYAKASGASTSDSYKVNGRATCWWYLRSLGIDQEYAASVNYDGVVYYNVNYVLNKFCVRPAIWITL